MPLAKFRFKNILILLLVAVVLGLIVLSGVIAFRVALTSYQVPKPEAIFVLGGNPARTDFAAKFSQALPHLDIWISDYQHHKINQQIIAQYQIPAQKVYYDLCGTDTVTNFTCTVEEFEQQNLRHLYLITADFHMNRARAIATFIFGSRGIIATPVPISTPSRSESWLLTLRDCLRSLIWLATGWSGASFNPSL